MTRISISSIHNFYNYPFLNFKNIRTVCRITPENYAIWQDGIKIWNVCHLL